MAIQGRTAEVELACGMDGDGAAADAIAGAAASIDGSASVSTTDGGVSVTTIATDGGASASGMPPVRAFWGPLEVSQPARVRVRPDPKP